MRATIHRLADEHRRARIAGGLSLRAAADASGGSRSQLWRFERGELDRVSLTELGAWFAVLGLDLSVKAYPAGDPIRDRAQVALLDRLRARLHPTLRWRTEVPLPIDGDLRAWDAEIRGRDPRPWRVRVEGETRVTDGQALERKLALKVRDDQDGHLLLLLADTKTNWRAVATLSGGLSAAFPASSRSILQALGQGREPPGSGIVFM